jgi:hypothetical protein
VKFEKKMYKSTVCDQDLSFSWLFSSGFESLAEAKEAEAAASGNAYYAPQDPHSVYMPQPYPGAAPPYNPGAAPPYNQAMAPPFVAPGTAPPPPYSKASKKDQWRL